jgi:hypothetical protein
MEQLRPNICIMMVLDMMRRIVTIFFFLSTLIGFSQIPNDLGYEDYKKRFPKESYVFLKLKSIDVFDIERGELKIESIQEEKILYLNNNAYNLSQRGLHYDQFSEIYDVEAFALNPQNGKYKKEKVKDFEEQQTIADGISFYDDSKTKKFTFPNLKEGSVSELRYKRKVKDLHLIHQRTFDLGFYRNLDVKQFKVHEDIDLGFKLFNLDSSGIEYSEVKEGKYTIYSWQLSNKKERIMYGDNENAMYYTPHIVPYVKSYKLNDERVDVFNNLEDLHSWYYSLLQQVNNTEKESLKRLADSLTNGMETDLEKVKEIYYWVQSKVKYIAFGDGYGGFIPRDPDLIYERRFGDCKDMSCLTINLLKELEIPAYFTWVGTRSIPYGYSELFTPQVDNHMIATYIDKQGKTYFLDATDSYLEFGRPSAFIQGKEVLISKGKKDYLLEQVPIMDANISSERDSVYLTIKEEKLVGKGNALFTGYYAAEVYRSFKDATDEQMKLRLKARLSKGSNKFISSNIDFKQINNSKDSLSVSYDFEIGSYLNYIGNAIYLDLNLSKQIKGLKVDDKHNTPLILDYKWKLNKVFVLDIPNGYSLSYLPNEKKGSNDMMEYTIKYSVNDNQIVYDFQYELKTIFVEVDKLKVWNGMVKKLSLDLDESIKLEK